MNRLFTQSVAGQATVTLTYYANGNIATKSDVGSYSYGLNAGPHAVTSAGGVSYSFDANGNNTHWGRRSRVQTGLPVRKVREVSGMQAAGLSDGQIV